MLTEGIERTATRDCTGRRHSPLFGVTRPSACRSPKPDVRPCGVASRTPADGVQIRPLASMRAGYAITGTLAGAMASLFVVASLAWATSLDSLVLEGIWTALAALSLLVSLWRQSAMKLVASADRVEITNFLSRYSVDWAEVAVIGRGLVPAAGLRNGLRPAGLPALAFMVTGDPRIHKASASGRKSVAELEAILATFPPRRTSDTEIDLQTPNTTMSWAFDARAARPRTSGAS